MIWTQPSGLLCLWQCFYVPSPKTILQKSIFGKSYCIKLILGPGANRDWCQKMYFSQMCLLHRLTPPYQLQWGNRAKWDGHNFRLGGRTKNQLCATWISKKGVFVKHPCAHIVTTQSLSVCLSVRTFDWEKLSKCIVHSACIVHSGTMIVHSA